MNKVLAMLIAACMVLAMVGPSVMADDASSTATVNNIAPSVTNKAESPNPVDLNAKGDSAGDEVVTITADVADDNGANDIASVEAVVTSSSAAIVATVTMTDGDVNGNYDGSFTLPYNTAPGSYTVVVTATDNGGLTGSQTNTLVVNSLNAISVGSMAFGSIAPGASADSSHAVANLGNVAVEFTEDAGDVGADYDTDGSIDHIMWTDFSGELVDGDMTTSYTAEDIGVDGNLNVLFTLNVPIGTLPVTETGTTTFTATIV